MGYDYLSQGFFQDSLADDGTDTIPFFYRTRSTYLNELKGIAGLRFVSADGNFTGDAAYEQLHDQFRVRLAQQTNAGNTANKLQIATDLEWRNTRSPDSLDESYLYGNLLLMGKTTVSSLLSLKGSARGEVVQFTGTPPSSYDYFRFQGKLGPSLRFNSDLYLDARVTATFRQAPDSSILSYQTFGSEFTLSRFGVSSSFELFGRGERKIVSEDAESGDLTRLTAFANGRFQVREPFFWDMESNLDWSDYASDDLLYNDFGSWQGAALFGAELGPASLSAGPEFDLQWEVSDIEADQDYTEWGGRIEAEVGYGVSLLASASAAAGRRDSRFEDEVTSDFTYVRVDFFGLWGLSSGLQLTALFSVDYERSDVSENNSSTALVSSSLIYSF